MTEVRQQRKQPRMKKPHVFRYVAYIQESPEIHLYVSSLRLTSAFHLL